MTALTFDNANRTDAGDLLRDVLELETTLDARRSELNELQNALNDFRLRYVEIVGSKMNELAELEHRIKTLEAGDVQPAVEDESTHRTSDFYDTELNPKSYDEPTLKHLRKLFWSLAKKFHPDQSATETERELRHDIMAQASRAYTEGDEDLLAQMLADGTLELHCVTARGGDADEDKRDGKFLVRRRDELLDQLRTIEYGIQRTRTNPLYKMKLECDADETRGRDALAEQAARISKRIKQAKLKLEQLEIGV